MKKQLIILTLIVCMALGLSMIIGCTDPESSLERVGQKTRDKDFVIILDGGEEAEGPVTFTGYYEAMKFDGTSETVEVHGDTPQEYSITGNNLYCNFTKESRYGVLRARAMLGEKVIDEAQTSEESGTVVITTTIHRTDYK